MPSNPEIEFAKRIRKLEKELKRLESLITRPVGTSGSIHDEVTVVDTATINLTLTGQQLQADYLGGGVGGGHTIQDEGVDKTQRTHLNFVGGNVAVSDDAVNDASVVTVSDNPRYIDQSGGTADTYGVLAGARNGVNVEFTVSQGVYASGSLSVYLNGQLLTQGTSEDWHEAVPASGTFHFTTAPSATDEITAIYGGAGSGGGRRHQSEITFIRHSLNPTYGNGVTTTYIWPGNALSSSLYLFYASLLTNSSIVYARWVIVWDPDAPGATPTGIRLVTCDSGPVNIVELQKFEVGSYTSERVDAVVITTDMQTLLTNGVDKFLGIQVRGDGSNKCLIYASWIEIVWE